MFYAFVGMVIFIMTPHGPVPEKVIGKLAHGEGFISLERCENYMQKTGYDSVDMIEKQIDAMPRRAVMSIKSKCATEGREI